MGRLASVVAASAALCVQAAGVHALAAEPRARVQGEMPEELRAAIVQAIGETDRPIDNRFEARRRARAAAEDAIAVLRSEGYYAYLVEPEVGEEDDAQPLVKVSPGPRFLLREPRLAWIGPAPDAEATLAANAALGLQPGQPGRAAEVIAAEGRAVAAVQQRGYADAAAQPREVVVDHADNGLSPEYRINAGALVRLNGLRLVTSGRTDPAWLERLAPWTPGQRYDPELVAELERRLLDAGVYEAITVALAPASDNTPEGWRPVVVSLAERQRRTLELGASYATEEGAGLDARWTRYNMLGRADTVALIGRLSNVDSRAGATLTLPHWRRATQTLTLGGAAYRVRTDAYDETGVGVRADITRRFGRRAYLFLGGSYATLGASLDFSRTNELRPRELTPLGRDLIIAALLADVALDRANDPLDPRRGWRAAFRAEPTLLTGEETLPYVRLSVQGSTYKPFGPQDRTVLAGRLRVGSIVGGSVPDVPASRRFFAGGGGSVRGFPYQGVGPRLLDNTPQGGVSLIEASVEARHDLTSKWGIAAFVDAGAVGSDQTPDFSDLAFGAGVGIRYNLGFGPIRVDVATPLTKRRGEAPFQIYVSLGQSF